MKSHNPSVIHLVSGKAELQYDELTLAVNELVLQQISSCRKASLWQITASVPDTAEEHRRYFREQHKRFTIDPQLEAAIAEEGTDVVFHLHGGMNPAFYCIAGILHKRSISFVFSPHHAYETIVAKKSSYLNSWYFRFYERKLLQKATAIHCVSELEAEGLKEIYPNTKTIQVPHGYNSSSNRTALPVRDKFVLGFCCESDYPRKGIDLIIHAFAFVKQVNTRAELWIFGECAQEALLRKKVNSRGLSEDVVFIGGKSAEERADLLGRINMMIEPACGEGLPVAVIEAASMGVPCVASACSVIGPAVRKYDCGEVMSNPDETELFNAIMTLNYRLSLDGVAIFAARAKEMVAAEFNWKQILPKLDRLYQVA